MTRREHRQRLTRAAVIAYILPLFALGPETVNGFFTDLWLRTAYASDCPAPSTCSTLYEYDDNGNLVRKLLDADGPSGSGEAVLAEEYGWDAENRLIWTDPSPGDDASFADIVIFRYDHDGIRVGRSRGGESVRYIIDRQQPYAQVLEERRIDDFASQAEALIVRYVLGDERIAQVRPSVPLFPSHSFPAGEPDPEPPPPLLDPPATTFYHYDGQMSVRQLTAGEGVPDGQGGDLDTGTLVNRYRYDAFGELIPGTPPPSQQGDPAAKNSYATVANSFLYTGEQYESLAGAPSVGAGQTGNGLPQADGLYYLRARYYAPGQGRFVSRDPFAGSADPRTLHKYAYAAQSPLTYNDPSGLVFTIAGTLKTAAIMGLLSGFVIGAIVGAQEGLLSAAVGAGVGAGIGLVTALITAGALLGAGGIISYLLGVALWKGFTFASILATLQSTNSISGYDPAEVQEASALDKAALILIIVVTFVQILQAITTRSSAGGAPNSYGTVYRIQDGTHRATAALKAGLKFIRVQVMDRFGGKALRDEEVPIESLRSLKEKITLDFGPQSSGARSAKGFADLIEEYRSNGTAHVPPPVVIESANPSVGTAISDVRILFGMGQP